MTMVLPDNGDIEPPTPPAATSVAAAPAKAVGNYNLIFTWGGRYYANRVWLRLVGADSTGKPVVCPGPAVPIGGALLPGRFRVEYKDPQGRFHAQEFPVPYSGANVYITMEGGQPCAGF